MTRKGLIDAAPRRHWNMFSFKLGTRVCVRESVCVSCIAYMLCDNPAQSGASTSLDIVMTLIILHIYGIKTIKRWIQMPHLLHVSNF